MKSFKVVHSYESPIFTNSKKYELHMMANLRNEYIYDYIIFIITLKFFNHD